MANRPYDNPAAAPLSAATAKTAEAAMAPKILTFLFTLAANAFAGVFILFTLLIAMNGYSESDAGWGLIAYAMLATCSTAAASLAATVMATALIRRKYSSFAAVLIAVVLLSVVGIVLEIGCSMISVGIAELVRIRR